MFHVTPRALGFISVGVWLAAIGSAAALAHELRPPVVLMAEEELPAFDSPAAAAVAVSLPRIAPEAADVLTIPEITIVGSVAQRAKPRAPPPAPAYRDITEMHCNEWRELSAGSGRVQICD